jgi:Fe-S-cluster containining protein
MHPACEACAGACCESFTIPLDMADDKAVDYATARGQVERLRGRNVLRIEARCPNLSAGSCAIHATRPAICEDYRVGGPECIAAIRSRRPKGDHALLVALAMEHP